MPPPEDYLAYERWFDKNHDSLKLPSDCKEPADPSLVFVTLHSWDLEWFLVFDDKHYVRISEHFSQRAKLQLARRLHFVFHYGPVISVASDGLPAHRSDDPVIIRIDNSHAIVHLHNGSPEPHIPQEGVRGLTLDTLDMFTFVKAVFEHRATGKSIADTLGYKVR